MKLATVIKLIINTKKEKNITNEVKWNEYSDLYIVATSEEGFTTLASKPAATLANKISASRKTKERALKSGHNHQLCSIDY